MNDQVTGIVGNTRSQQEKATSSREEQKQANWSLSFKIGIGATLLSIAVLLSLSGLNLFWKLVTAFTFYKVGSVLIGKKSEMLWIWPQILKYAGIVTFMISVLGSGIGAWTESIVKSVDTTASCAADPTQKVCVEKAAKKAAEKAAAEKQRLAAMVRQQPVVIQTPQINYPVESSCDEGYASLKGCKKITLKGEATYQRTALKGVCLSYSPKDLVKREDLGGSTYRFSAARSGEVVVHFFDLPLGETFDSFTCG